MKKIILLFIILLLFSGCTLKKDDSAPETEEQFVTSQTNSHIKIDFLSIVHNVENNEEGFWINFRIEQLDDEPLTEENYSFSLPNQLTIDEYIYESKGKKTEFLENEAHFSQFFTPRLQKSTERVPLTLYIKPTFYKHEVIFHHLTNGSKNIMKNDMVLVDVEVEGNKLHLIVHDVHPLVGLKSSLVINNEEIFPTFSSTEHNKTNNTLHITQTFLSPLPEQFTLKFTRHRLENVVWDAPFILPAKK